jgi:cytochrome P450
MRHGRCARRAAGYDEQMIRDRTLELLRTGYPWRTWERGGPRVGVGGGRLDGTDAFAQEVRRLHPFVPVLAARARCAQDVLGVPVPRGGLVVLDV